MRRGPWRVASLCTIPWMADPADASEECGMMMKEIRTKYDIVPVN
jgi:hypothetical protein